MLIEIAGSRELMGADVVRTHRLLKNSVTAATGLRGYAFWTEGAVLRFGIDAAALAMTPHRERFEDVGEIAGSVHNLELRWKEEQARQAVYIPPGQGIRAPEVVTPAPPAVVWDYLTAPEKRPLWEAGIQRVDQKNRRGIPGVGTTNHCIHGQGAFDEEILDWKPFRYYSFRLAMRPMGEMLFTTELTPVEGGSMTHIATRLLLRGNAAQRLLARLMGGRFRASYRLNLTNLLRLVSAIEQDAARWAVPEHEPTLPSVLAARQEEEAAAARRERIR